MKLAVLFSGGKDSCLALFLAKKYGYEVSCLISIVSENEDSYMFHTPSISRVESQAEVMGIPLIIQKTKGEKEKELRDLEVVIKKVQQEYGVQGIVTGAIESIYQASRVQKICSELGLECFNPLWQKDQFELLDDLVENKFKVIVVGVSAYPLDKNFLGREIDKKFIAEMKGLQEKFKINPAGEGGEFESFVLDCPLFKKELQITNKEISGSGNSWRMEVGLE